MKIHLFPPSGRVIGIVAVKNYLALDCEFESVDLGVLRIAVITVIMPV
jgi:glutathione S-transferase